MDCLTLEHKACKRLEKQLHRLARRESPLDASNSILADEDSCGRLDWLMHDLIRLVSESPDRPVAEMRPTIRRVLIERLFVDCNGDTALCAAEHVDIDLFVRTVTQVLESVRADGIETGEWAGTPATPQMFG